MNSSSVYTLLVVESPVLSNIIQELCPASVYVIATGGYCWRPVYNAAKNELQAKADPDKIDIRRELKEQAQWANSIVIATDSDPSGDFIAWSVAKFLKTSTIRRGSLQSLSKQGIISMLSDVREIDISLFETRLRNLFLIQREWTSMEKLPPKDISGLAAIFFASNHYTTFLDNHGRLYKSSAPLQCNPDEWLSVQKSSGRQFETAEPLSTFSLLQKAVAAGISDSFHEAQVLLQKLFQTVLPDSRQSLISYPRSAAASFYSGTWENFRRQNLKSPAIEELKPIFLQEIATPDLPHDSIYPLDLSIKPDVAGGQLPSQQADLYKLIYENTLKSIQLPGPVSEFFVNELNPDIYFYPDTTGQAYEKNLSLRPCVTVGALGKYLHELGICKPSDFGEKMDSWIAGNILSVNNSVVIPKTPITKLGNLATVLKEKLRKLKVLEDQDSLSPETVRTLLTS